MKADPAVRAPLRRVGSPGTVVFGATARAAVQSGAVWGYIFGIVVASSAISYTRIYKTQSDRDHLAAAFGFNRASAALFGPAPRLQTVAGFTVFKSIMTLMVLGAIWGLLISTKRLRGEEDAGRWELLLTGQTTPRRATVHALGGLAMGAAMLWVITAVISVLTGRYSKVNIDPGPMLYFSLAQVATAVMFLAVGALASQLAATRRRAVTYAGWFLGASYTVRMVADSGVGLHGLIWVSPLGWVEELQPLTSPQPFALLPVVGFVTAVALATIRLAGRPRRRRQRAPRPPHASAPTAVALRPARPFGPSATSERHRLGVRFGVTGLVLGLIAGAAGATISGSSVQTVFARLGAPGTGVEAFLGVSFLVLAVTGFVRWPRARSLPPGPRKATGAWTTCSSDRYPVCRGLPVG